MRFLVCYPLPVAGQGAPAVGSEVGGTSPRTKNSRGLGAIGRGNHDWVNLLEQPRQVQTSGEQQWRQWLGGYRYTLAGSGN